MSRWATKPDRQTKNESETPLTSDPAPGIGGAGAASPSQPKSPIFPWWLKLTPFFLSAFLFLSGFFSILSPLPLIFLNLQGRRSWAWLAAATNAVIVAALHGPAYVVVYALFALVIALSLPEYLRRSRTLERAAGYTLLTVALAVAGVISGLAYRNHVTPMAELDSHLTHLVDYLDRALPPGTGANLTPETEDGTVPPSATGTGAKGAADGSSATAANPEEWKQNLLAELPFAISVSALLMVWANLVVILRMNPRGIRDHLGLDATFFRNWKAPEFLLWPTILAGFFVVYDVGRPSEIALSVFKVLMAVYAIQGMSILSYLFDAWSIRGMFRSIGYLVVIFLMLPLLLSMGFFDLWFDFRAKLRQS